MTEPIVRAVVVNWNGKPMLRECLQSLLDQDLPPDALEIVLVDNASNDGSVDFVRATFPTVIVVENATNSGFAGGVNSGLGDLEAKYVALLNNDAYFEPDAIRRMITVLEEPAFSDVGAVTALVLLDNEDPRIVVNSTGNVVTRQGAATDRDWLTPRDLLDADPEVFGFCGGAAVLRVAALTEVGVFDESLFLYYEDTDLSWRLRGGGWRIRYESTAVAWHKHAQSSDPASSLFRFYNNRNALLVFARYASLRVVFRAVARQSLALVWHWVRRDEPTALLQARARALGEAYGRILRERRAGRPVRRSLDAIGGRATAFGK